jgi:ABC-2 type transport system ATP-binding protein
MKRRLDLAITMIERPALVFLDEPTTGLDPRSREQVWGTVRDLADDGVTILLTTQYLDEADQLADAIALLDHGQVVARGTADELKSSIGTEVVRLQFGDADSYARALREYEPVRADRRLRILEVASNGSAAQVREMLGHLETAGAPALKVSTHRPSLDDVFLSLTGDTAPKELAR